MELCREFRTPPCQISLIIGKFLSDLPERMTYFAPTFFFANYKRSFLGTCFGRELISWTRPRCLYGKGITVLLVWPCLFAYSQQTETWYILLIIARYSHNARIRQIYIKTYKLCNICVYSREGITWKSMGKNQIYLCKFSFHEILEK